MMQMLSKLLLQVDWQRRCSSCGWRRSFSGIKHICVIVDSFCYSGGGRCMCRNPIPRPCFLVRCGWMFWLRFCVSGAKVQRRRLFLGRPVNETQGSGSMRRNGSLFKASLIHLYENTAAI